MGRLNLLYVRIIRGGFRYRFRLARMTRWPLVGRMMDKAFFEGDDLFVLPRDEIAVEIPLDMPDVVREDTMLPSRVVRHFVEASKHHFIMDRCICRTSARCEDYPRDLGCLFLGRAVLKIDPRMGRLVSREEALDHVDRAERAGLVHLIGRNKIDSVWTSAKPKEELMTICHCCPCCCLWKMLPELSPGISSKVKRLPGLSVTVNDACAGCGDCLGSCYLGAIGLHEGRAVIDQEACRGCGRCVPACPHDAIVMNFADPDAVTMVIEELGPLVDVTKQ